MGAKVGIIGIHSRDNSGDKDTSNVIIMAYKNNSGIINPHYQKIVRYMLSNGIHSNNSGIIMGIIVIHPI